MGKTTDSIQDINYRSSSCLYSLPGNSFRNLPALERYFVRYHYAPHLAIVLIFCLVSPAVIGYSNLATAVLVAAVMILVILSIISSSGGTIAYGRLFAGSFAEIIFLGSISFLAGSLTNQFILGYMAGFMYYAVNLGASKYLGHFALFQMIRGTYDFIPWMLVLSAAFFIVGTICNEQRS